MSGDERAGGCKMKEKDHQREREDARRQSTYFPMYVNTLLFDAVETRRTKDNAA